MAQKEEDKESLGQMIPEREEKCLLSPLICGTANISWLSSAAKEDSSSANSFLKGISKKGRIG